MVLAVVIAIVIIGAIVYGILSKRHRQQAMAALAAQKGWTALSNDDATLSSYLPTYIRMLGQQNFGMSNFSRTTSAYDMAYQANISGHSAVLFQYQYTEYSQNIDPQQPAQSTVCYFTVLSLAMPVAEPTIMLLHHNFLSKLNNFGLHQNLEKINLEGDFNQYYDTYIAPNSQVEALSLLTPDVMELVTALAGSQTHASLQISGPSLIISFENQLLTPEFIEPLLAQLTALLAKLDTKPRAVLQPNNTPTAPV